MPGISPDQHRTVIPRWRAFGATLSLGELGSGRSDPVSDDGLEDVLFPRALAWRTHRSVGHATDFVGAALSVGRVDLAESAAKFLCQQEGKISPWAVEIAERALRD